MKKFGYEYKHKYKLNEFGGEHYIFKFDNGYGASVSQRKYPNTNRKYLWELAVIRYINDEKYVLDYNTIIASDIVGHLSEVQVNIYLESICGLEETYEQKIQNTIKN